MARDNMVCYPVPCFFPGLERYKQLTVWIFLLSLHQLVLPLLALSRSLRLIETIFADTVFDGSTTIAKLAVRVATDRPRIFLGALI